MRRHLQDYSFKSILRRNEAPPPQPPKAFEKRANALTTAYLTNLRLSNSNQAASTGLPANKNATVTPAVPPLRLSNANGAVPGSQSARAFDAGRGAGAEKPTAETARANWGSGARTNQSHSSEMQRLSSETSQSGRILHSLHGAPTNTNRPRPRLPLLSSRVKGNAQQRHPLWEMAPSIPKLFASLVTARRDTGLAAIDEHLSSDSVQPVGSSQGGRIGLEHWMEFCRETDAFVKLHVAPSDCIFSFRRGVEAAGSNDSALARKTGLVMNLEAFCGCVVTLAELAGAMQNDLAHAPSNEKLHAVWDCDPGTSRACSLILLKLLAAAPGVSAPKSSSLNITSTADAAGGSSSFPHPPPLPRRAEAAANSHAPSLPTLSSSPRRPLRQCSSPDKQTFLDPKPPPPRKPSFAYTEDHDSSEVSSPSKSKGTSFKSSALTASPPYGAPRHRASRARAANTRIVLPSAHHVVDVATGSEFLKWFQDKLTQIGSDGLAYPVRIVAVQVKCRVA